MVQEKETTALLTPKEVLAVLCGKKNDTTTSFVERLAAELYADDCPYNAHTRRFLEPIVKGWFERDPVARSDFFARTKPFACIYHLVEGENVDLWFAVALWEFHRDTPADEVYLGILREMIGKGAKKSRQQVTQRAAQRAAVAAAA